MPGMESARELADDLQRFLTTSRSRASAVDHRPYDEMDLPSTPAKMAITLP